MTISTFGIFKGLHDRHAKWVDAVEGQVKAERRMNEMAAKDPGQYFVFSAYTHTVIAVTDTSKNQATTQLKAKHAKAS
jgi:hypothetical protein